MSPGRSSAGRLTAEPSPRAPAGRRGRAAQPAAARDADELALEQELGDLLGLKVSLAHKGAAGRLTLHYGSLEQLDDLLDRLRR